MLAAKTPPTAAPNAHHHSLILAELKGWNVPMDGRVPIEGGDVRRGPEGEIGVQVDEFDEAVALERWKNHEFLEIERQIAKRCAPTSWITTAIERSASSGTSFRLPKEFLIWRR
jgi:hypothetical protein